MHCFTQTCLRLGKVFVLHQNLKMDRGPFLIASQSLLRHAKVLYEKGDIASLKMPACLPGVQRVSETSQTNQIVLRSHYSPPVLALPASSPLTRPIVSRENARLWMELSDSPN